MGEHTNSTLLALNVVPDGMPAWLTYSQHRALKNLILATADYDPAAIAELYSFLVNMAGLTLSATTPDEAVRFNGYALMRKGYKIEALTEDEYRALKSLYLQATPTEVDDMELHNTGTHRAIYDMLISKLGMSVEAGRGPVWRRAQQLLNHNGPKYEAEG